MNSTHIDGRRLVIVGGSSGIGLELARQAGADGARLILVGRDATKLARSAAQLHDAETAVADAHDEGAMARVFDELGPIDDVVSLVGDSMSGGFLDTPEATMRHVLHSKFWSNWQLARAAAPCLGDGGSMTFTAGTGGRPHEVSASHVANLGVAALVEGLAVELAPAIRVNAVAPTFMGGATSFWRALPSAQLAEQEARFVPSVPLGRLATVAEVASTYRHLLENRFITGQVVAVDGGVMLS